MSNARNLAGFARSISSNNNLNIGIVTASSFSGNLTGTATSATNASGLIGTPNIAVGNITGVAATFTGNVSIAGTLTYEDVTNVDSVGLVTARSGAHVATSSGNLLVGTTSATGTASQLLQVTGGAYFGGGVGMGTTNPLSATSALHINNASYHGVSGNALLRIVSIGGVNYLQSGITPTTGSAAPLVFGTIFAGNEWARIDSVGRLLVGTSSARTSFFNSGLTPQLQLEVADAAHASIVRNTNNTGGAIFTFGKTRSVSVGGNTIVANGDDLGYISFQGADGTDFAEAASISAAVDGTPGNNDMPGRLVFSTTADGASSPTERARIDSSGRFGLGTSSPRTTSHVAKDSNAVSSEPFGDFQNNGQLFITGKTNPDKTLALGVDTTLANMIGVIQSMEAGITARPLVLNPSGGNIGIGTTNPASKLTVVENPLNTAIETIGNINSSSRPNWNFAGLYLRRTASNIATAKQISFLLDGDSASDTTLTNYLNIWGTYSGTPTTSSTSTGLSAVMNLGAPSGIALHTNGSERARIDSSGRLLVGTSSARSNYFGGGFAPVVQVEGSTTAASAISAIRNSADDNQSYLILAKSRSSSYGTVSSGDSIGEISFQAADGTNFLQAARITATVDGTPGTNDMPGRLVFSTTADGAASPTKALVIDSSQYTTFSNSALSSTTTGFTGVVAAPFGAISISRAGSNVLAFFHSSNANGTSGASVGTISITTTATAYNTSSDYRLKENVTAVTDGINRLQQLKPSRFNFIADPGKTVDGFLAHEAAEVVPECVTGEKDAVDDEGNPEYQGIDQSKLVPLLTAALQEAIAKIESLEARLTAAGI